MHYEGGRVTKHYDWRGRAGEGDGFLVVHACTLDLYPWREQDTGRREDPIKTVEILSHVVRYGLENAI